MTKLQIKRWLKANWDSSGKFNNWADITLDSQNELVSLMSAFEDASTADLMRRMKRWPDMSYKQMMAAERVRKALTEK